jgi:hypothetical protein
VDTARALAFFEAFFPFLALAALLATLVVAINMHGRRLDKHSDWLTALDVRLQNLHKQREATWARVLRRTGEIEPTERALVPPPLPPRAPTLDAADWRDDDSVTEELLKKDTGRYPQGVPPLTPEKGPDDDDAER